MGCCGGKKGSSFNPKTASTVNLWKPAKLPVLKECISKDPYVLKTFEGLPILTFDNKPIRTLS